MKEKELVKQGLLSIVDSIDCGNSEVTSEDCLSILDYINRLTNTKQKLSKYQACEYLGVSRATFDNGVRDGKIPIGQKQAGFKEKFGTLADLKPLKLNDNN